MVETIGGQPPISSEEHQAISAQEEQPGASSSSNPVVGAEDMRGALLPSLQVQTNTEIENNQSDSDSEEDEFFPMPSILIPLFTFTPNDKSKEYKWPLNQETVIAQLQPATEELPKEVLLPEDRELDKADYGNSKNAYDMDVLSKVFIRNASGKIKKNGLFKKIIKGILPTGIDTLVNIAVGETISFLSS